MDMKVSLRQPRSYNFDLLKVVLMYGIVIFHIVAGGSISCSHPFSANYEVLNFIYTATGCAVNAYAMITGYFGVNETTTKYTNLVMLWLRAFWYCVFIAFAFAVLLPGSVGVRLLLRTFFPITGRAYWYLTAYFMLFLFKPILNAAIKSFSQPQFGGLCSCI